MKQCINLMLFDEKYTSFDISVLVHKMGRRGGGGGAFFNFDRYEGRLFEGGMALLRGFTVK